MIQIAEKVEKLLLTNDCVIISSFGGFIKNNSAAIIKNNKIIPPQTIISFNSMLKHDDGLLSSLIAEEKDISYKSASLLLAKQVEHLKQELKSQSKIVFGNIGNLYLIDNNIVFTPFEATYLPENFGLSPIYITERHKIQKIGTNIEIENRKIIINTAYLGRKIIRHASFIALIITLAIFAPYTSNKGQYAGLLLNNTLQKNQNNKEKYIESDSVLSMYAATVENNLKKHNIYKVVKDIKTITLTSTPLPQNYHIVIASFNNIAQAEDFCLSNKNFFANMKILKSKGNPAKYRCIISSFATKNEAIKIQKSAGKATKSWILFQKQ